MKTYCKILEDVYYGDNLVWKQDEEYLVTYEDDKAFYFGSPIKYAIAKNYIDSKFDIICKP